MSETAMSMLGSGTMSEIRDPYTMFAEMRRTTPVCGFEVRGKQVYLVLRYDDVEFVLKHPDLYSSSIMSEVMGPVMGRTILEMDGRDHTVHRGLISNAFRPHSIRRYAERHVEPIVDEVIERLEKNGPRADLVRELTEQVPIQVIARMIGVDAEDVHEFQQYSLDIVSFRPEVPEKGLAASRAIKNFLRPILAERRRTPQDDLLSELCVAEVEGEKLSDDEIFGFALLLLPAGAETTFRLMGNVLFALLTHPHFLGEVRDDRAEVEWAIEETLRWETPLPGTARCTTRETELRGVTIPQGALVSIMLGAANRDPGKYDDPDRFDLHRRADDHLAFAVGKHFCLGYHLAKLEVRTALNAVLDRLPNLRLDPREECWIQGVSFRSPNRLPVMFG